MSSNSWSYIQNNKLFIGGVQDGGANSPKIVYSKDVGASRFQIFWINPDGTGETNISNNAYNDFVGAVDVDNKQIAYMSNINGFYELYVADFNTNNGIHNPVKVTNSNTVPVVLHFCSFSSDGNLIFYAEQASLTATVAIKVYNIATTATTTLATSGWGGAYIADIHLNNAGDKLIISSDIIYFELSMYDVSYSPISLSNFTTFVVSDSFPANTSYTDFTLNEAENEILLSINFDDIYKYDFSYSSPQLSNNALIESAGSNRFPSYNPEETFYVWASDRDGDFEIYKKEISSGTVTQLTVNADLDLTRNQSAWVNIPVN